MKELFLGGSNVRGMKLEEFTEWAKQSDLQIAAWGPSYPSPPDYGVLALPPVQRTPVWGPRQIVDLWDSVLRGLPIGSVYLVKRDNSMARGNGFDAPLVDVGEGWDLLDGQQRVRALLLGSRGPSIKKGAEDKRCLWLDLAATSQTHLFSIHFTSESQPFGYKVENGQKLSADDRRSAREEIEPDAENDPIVQEPCLDIDGEKAPTDARRAYTHELFKGFIDKTLKPKKATKGWDEGLPPLPFKTEKNACFPFHILLDAWLQGKTDSERLGNLRIKLADIQIEKTVIDSLHRAFCNFASGDIALLQIRVTDDQLLLLFDRIGAGGSPLTAEERLFSIYKYHEPKIHDVVNAIYNDAQVGRVLPPTKIAACAIRIANAHSHEEFSQGNYLPDVKNFAAEMNGIIISNQIKRKCTIKSTLAESLPIPSIASLSKSADGKLADAFRILFKILRYTGRNGDPGIPAVMQTRLTANLIQVLLLWTMATEKSDPGGTARARHELIRFVLFWGLCVTNEDKASGRCFERIRRGIEACEIKHLYEDLVNQNSDLVALRLAIPAEIKGYFIRSSESPVWRPFAKRFPVDAGIYIELAKKWWYSSEYSLLWLQRSYLDRSFPDFDPSSGRDDETPYDVDHIIPHADWGGNWQPILKRLRDSGVFNNDELNVMRWARSDLGESIGNKWLVDFSNNRKWGDHCWDDKLNELRSEHLLSQDDEIKWNIAWGNDKAKAKVREWSQERIAAFEEVIERRAAWLYEQWYNGAGFFAWEQRTS